MKNRKLFIGIIMSSIIGINISFAEKYYRPLLISNNSGSNTSTNIGKSIFVGTTPGPLNWSALPNQTLPIASAPKTIAATVKYGPNSKEPIAAIMYRDAANGYINITEPIAVSEDGNYTVTTMGGTPVLHAVTGAPFTHEAEEIEMDPISGDIFVLAKNGNSRQIFRIDRNTNEATVMTLYTVPGPVSSNGNKIYWNTITGKYKNGSIAFVPNPLNANEFLLAFTHESDLPRYRFCTWYFLPSVAKLIMDPSNMNRCWGVNSHNVAFAAPPLSALLPGTGLNTAYAEGKFIVARDNGVLMKIDWPSYPFGTSLTSPPFFKNLNDDGTATAFDMKSDFAYWRNF